MKIKKYITPLSVKAGLLALVSLGGCIATTLPYMRTETAQRLAAPAWMVQREIAALPFSLKSYERIHDKGGVANIYIEGNGPEDVSSWAINPTPANPTALHLATKDNAENVIYIARPCQFTGLVERDKNCPPKYWKDARYSREVIDAYNSALDILKKRHRLRTFNLIGYEGGGAIATILAAERTDIVTLRTINGMLDHRTYNTINQNAHFTESLNPVDFASNLENIAQTHMIGAQNKNGISAVTSKYLQALPPSKCVRAQIVQEAGTRDGWVDKWPQLLKLPVDCLNDVGIYTPISAEDIPADPNKKEPVPLKLIKQKPEKP